MKKHNLKKYGPTKDQREREVKWSEVKVCVHS
jgi:hypothetical protein